MRDIVDRLLEDSFNLKEGRGREAAGGLRDEAAAEIRKLREQRGAWLNATADARQQRDALRKALERIASMIAPGAETAAAVARAALDMAGTSRGGGREENNEGDRLDDSGIYSDGSEGKA